MKYSVIIKINLEYVFDVDSKEDAKVEAENVELPDNYFDNSFDIVQIVKVEGE